MIGVVINTGLVAGAVISFWLCDEGKISRATRKKALLLTGMALLLYWVFYDVSHNSAAEIFLQLGVVFAIGLILLWYFAGKENDFGYRTIMLVVFLGDTLLMYGVLHHAVPEIDGLVSTVHNIKSNWK